MQVQGAQKKDPRKQGEWEAEEEQEEGEQEQETLGNDAKEQTGQECRWVEQAQALQGKRGQMGQLESGLRPCLTPLEALEALQRELIPLNNQASREHSRLKLRIDLRRRHHLAKRSALLQGIPGFWAKAVSFTLVKGGLQRAGPVQWDGQGGGMFRGTRGIGGEKPGPCGRAHGMESTCCGPGSGMCVSGERGARVLEADALSLTRGRH